MIVLICLIGFWFLAVALGCSFSIGRRIGRRQVAQQPPGELLGCFHDWGEWREHQRHTQTEYSSISGGKVEKFTPVMRRTCELCKWQEDKKVPLT